jgi:hypothetical protein
MRTVKLMSDYGCHALWEASLGEVGNIDPASLPISADLQHALALWAECYDRTLNQDDPRASGFASDEEEALFKSKGLSLAARLRDELGHGYTVTVHL